MARRSDLTISAGARVAAIYLGVALVYIYTSDWILARLVTSKESFHFWEVVKGFSFVLASAAGLFFLINRELAKRRTAEAEVASHAKRLQEIADALPQPLIIVSVDRRRLLFANRRALIFAGLANNEGQAVAEIGNFFARPEEFDEVLAEVLRDGESAGREIAARHADCYDVFLAVSARRMTYGGADAVCATFTDLSEIREARHAERRTHQLLQEILDNLPAGVALKDLDGRYLLASRRYIELMLEGDATVVGRCARDLYPAEMAESFELQDREVAATQVPQSYEVLRGGPGNAARVIQLTKFPVFAPSSELETVGCIAFDVSEQRAMEQQLRRTERLETLGQMTGGIAHDFNNLLAAILGNAELLSDEPEDVERVRQAAKVIEEASLRGADLTRRLLVFARQQSLRNEALNIGAVMEDLKRLLERSMGEDIDLKIDLPEDLWPIEVDRSQFENAILNFAVNARDAMPNGGRLRIAAENVDAMAESLLVELKEPAERYVCITVSDNGAGMAAEVLDHIYEPFFTTKEPGKGTGLGLSTVYGFARQSNGAVRAESREGRGTTMYLYLPRAKSRGAGKPLDPKQPLALRAGAGGRVLVVEDDPDVRGYIVQVLGQLGFEVVEAENANAALEQLREDRDFDLLFSDMVMPGGLTGRDLAEEAKRLRPEMRILLTTGYADHPSLETADTAEIAFLRKPYRREELIAALNATLAA